MNWQKVFPSESLIFEAATGLIGSGRKSFLSNQAEKCYTNVECANNYNAWAVVIVAQSIEQSVTSVTRNPRFESNQWQFWLWNDKNKVAKNFLFGPNDIEWLSPEET